jgi:hypothetical protein
MAAVVIASCSPLQRPARPPALSHLHAAASREAVRANATQPSARRDMTISNSFTVTGSAENLSLRAAPAVSSSPSPEPSALKPIARVIGRGTNLVRHAAAASSGTIGREEIFTRPILRPGEVLEAIPGLVITQHSGEGKANQYYLRGFQLDHGTDLAGTVDGVPINLPTQAHGQGYSDINWLIPELVDYVAFEKGPYYASQGDFSAAGAYQLFYRNTVPETLEFGAGSYGYDRFLAAGSHAAGSGNLLYGVELFHDNGSFVLPDDYRKINGVLRWSRQTAATNFNVTAWAYGGIFNSTDQIPQRLVDANIISRLGYIDPTDGGQTSRYALSGEYQHQDPNGSTAFDFFGFQQYLNLYSDFTYWLDDATDYYNVHDNPVTCTIAFSTCHPGPHHVSTYTSYCPANQTSAAFTFSCPDQREQQDERFVSGFNFSTVGAGLRNDNIPTVALYLTDDRVRYPNGTLSDDHVVERDENLWVQSVLHFGSKLRVIPGLRADQYYVDVYAPSPANSGNLAPGIVSPKVAAAYAMSPNQELYADWGDSFHSNDARGVTQTLDPQTHATVDATGQPVMQDTPLVRAIGEEIGYRYSQPKLTSTVSLWQLNLASELVFNGDDGTTSAGGPTKRYGVEFANFYRPLPWLTIDGDLSTSSARFTEDTLQPGTYVPESLNEVIAAGITVDEPRYSASLRLRYFGPRTLDTEGTAVSAPSTILNGQYTAKLSSHYNVTVEALNITNAQVDDVEYYYASWLPHDAANRAYAANPAIDPLLGGTGVNDYVFHPAELRSVRLELAVHP